jgi:hypothetical protein
MTNDDTDMRHDPTAQSAISLNTVSFVIARAVDIQGP